MAKAYKFGQKMKRKSWDSSEFDQQAEERKAIFLIVGVIVVMILLAMFLGWVKKTTS